MTIKIAEILDLNIQYITNKDGEKTAVVLPIQEFEQILKITNQFLQENYPETPYEFAQNDIWNIAQKITEDLTEEELEELPIDGSQQHDHYIYGTQKK